jgi:hypothetical protein
LTSWLKKYKKQTIIFDQFSCSSVISECQSWQKFKYYVKKIKNVCIFANSNTDNQLKMFKNYWITQCRPNNVFLQISSWIGSPGLSLGTLWTLSVLRVAAMKWGCDEGGGGGAAQKAE